MEEVKQNIIGEGNLVDIGSLKVVKNSSISIKGNRNKIIISDGVWLRDWHLVVESSDNLVQIDRNSLITGRFIMKLADGGCIKVGEGTTMGSANLICGEGKKIHIGKDCMLAWGIEIRTTDSHGIMDAETGNRINFGDDIIIGDHVWIGAQATLMKGSLVARDSVVGIRSLITKKFEESNVVISGVPGGIVKRGITWDRKLLG